MFGRSKPEFDPQDHPQVIKALEVMYTDAYEAGKRDALALLQEWLEGLKADREQADDPSECVGQEYLDGVEDAILTVENG